MASDKISIPAIDKVRTDSDSSSDEPPVGAGSSNSKKGKKTRGNQQRESVKKTPAKKRLTPTDPEWPKDVPDTFESCEKIWKSEGIVFREVIHQGPFETCWGLVYTESIEAALNVKAKQEGRNLHPNLSAQHLINNTSNIALQNGSMRRFKLVTKFIREEGLVKEEVCEYTGNIHQGRCTHATEEVTKIKKFIKIKKGCINEKDLIKLVAARPVMVQMEAFESFGMFKGDGIYAGPTPKEARKKDQVSLHAVLLIGYGTINGIHYWIVRNSYGKEWGDNGYAKVIRQYSPGNNNPSLFAKVRYPEI